MLAIFRLLHEIPYVEYMLGRQRFCVPSDSVAIGVHALEMFGCFETIHKLRAVTVRVFRGWWWEC